MRDAVKKLTKAEGYETASSIQKIRAITNKKHGFDELPIIVDESTFEKLAYGRIKLYRGVHSGNGVYFTAIESIVNSRQYKRIDGRLICSSKRI